MKLAQRVGALFGIGSDRSSLPPQYVAVADGLIVTEEAAEAWYVLSSSNTDLMSPEDRDAEQDVASSALARTLTGYHCHLRVLWSPLHAEDYLHEAEELFNAGAWEEWAALRVERVDMLNLPTRHLLLGVRISDRASAAQARGKKATEGAFGLGSSALPARELARLDGLARRLGRRLEATPWKARPATADMLAWMLAREQRRDLLMPSPRDGVIEGAQLATLTRGRVLPYPDHLRVLDAQGEPTAWVSVLTMSGFPEEMISPGGGEWLRMLSDINYVPLVDDETALSMDAAELITSVNPESSVRFRVLPKKEALTRVNDSRKSAKEQTRSARQHSAEEAGRAIEETEDEMSELDRDLRRRDLTLVEDHPRVIVSSTTSLEDLWARVDAVVTAYGGVGIEVTVGEEEQRELWVESQPGDRVRVPDMGHVRDVDALSGSWWWGGAQVGDDAGPIVGYLTGSTQGVYRNDLTAGSERGDATTTAYIGRSGRGKTTSMMLDLMNAAFRGSFVLALDFKGDLGGLVNAGKRYGLNCHLLETGRQFAGVADLFRLLAGDAQEAALDEVPAQLGIAVPPHLRDAGAETPIQAAVNIVAQQPDPATWRVIEELRASDDKLARETGESLHGLAQTPIGAPFMGRPRPDAPQLHPEPGIWVVRMPGLSLPKMGAKSWNRKQRLSVALMHSMLAYGVTTAGRSDLRGMRKVVAVPEVHILTATDEGANFLNYIARVGRALSTALALDSQDPEGIARMTGVAEALTTIAGFEQQTKEQQDALAEMLGLAKGQHTRDFLKALGRDADGEIRHGHCIVRDRRGQSATVQFDVPTEELVTLLDTSPKAVDQGDEDEGQEHDGPAEDWLHKTTPEGATR